jgi:glutamate 5-kinase
MTVAEVKQGIADGWISGGMIPKVETCIYAVEQGVKGAVILDGRVPHAVLRELFTDGGAGTLITARDGPRRVKVRNAARHYPCARPWILPESPC